MARLAEYHAYRDELLAFYSGLGGAQTTEGQRRPGCPHRVVTKGRFSTGQNVR